MFDKIKDSIAERMIEKIIEEKSINISLSINKRSDREYKDIADVLTDSDIDMKISFDKKGEYEPFELIDTHDVKKSSQPVENKD